MAELPLNTFPNHTNYRYAQTGVASRPVAEAPTRTATGIRWSVSNPSAVVNGPSSKKPKGDKGNFKVDRFEDLRGR